MYKIPNRSKTLTVNPIHFLFFVDIVVLCFIYLHISTIHLWYMYLPTTHILYAQNWGLKKILCRDECLHLHDHRHVVALILALYHSGTKWQKNLLFCFIKDGHIKTIHSANLTRFYIKSKTMMIYRITCRIMFIFSRFCAKLVFHPFSANLYTTHKGLGEICCSIF